LLAANPKRLGAARLSTEASQSQLCILEQLPYRLAPQIE